MLLINDMPFIEYSEDNFLNEQKRIENIYIFKFPNSLHFWLPIYNDDCKRWNK